MPVVPLIRHAEGSFGSAVYDVLSECGHAQVDALRRALERCGVVPDHVVSGSLRRQRYTARPWAATIDKRWNEYDDGRLPLHLSDEQSRGHDAGSLVEIVLWGSGGL
jgi:broad specificity phosphatase PhoE